MDPLSLTASIIAVLQLTSTLTSYISEARSATADQVKVAVEAGNLYSLLTTLRFRVEEARSDDPWFNQVKLLGRENGPLDQFKIVLETMVGLLSSSRTRDQIKSALLWKFTKKEVENALARMERLKSLISCALTNDLIALSKAIRDDIVVVREQTRQLYTKMERLQTLTDQELQNKLSQWLGVPDPSINYHAALQKRHPETGQWLLNDQHFADWKDSTSSLIWLHGSAGCGKTILSAASLHHILQHKESYPDTMVSYFYFDFNDAEKQSPRKAIRSLLFQFTLQARDIVHDLELLYQKCSSGQQQPAEDVIHSLFREAITRPGEKYIILDALDECIDREELLTFLREMVSSKPRGLRVLATSRRERDIDDELSPVANHIINIQSAIVDADVCVYIRGRMATDTKLKKWPDSVQNEIMTALMKKASGMFRWVYCQLESVRQCVKLGALRKSLSSLPKTLDETYNRILRDLESRDQLPDAIKALQWLCFSDRPFQSSEMVDILAIENGDRGGFFPEERLPDPTDIMVICSSLISLNPINGEDPAGSSKDNKNNGHKFQIQLAHFSVKEFLLSDRCAFSLDFRSQICHPIIVESCLHYLLHLFQDGPMTEELITQYPLSMYAAQQWWQHLRAIKGVLNDTLLDLTSRLLTNEDASLLSWLQLYNIDTQRTGFDASLKARTLAQPLYYAARIGVPAVVEKITRRNIDVNAQGGMHGSALQVASDGGHETIVKMLLDAGADVNAQGGYFGNALHAASAGGHETVVKMLLDAGADVNAQLRQFSGNSLHAASKGGHETVVKMLLDAGIDVNDCGGEFCNALQAASAGGYETVVKMLLDAGADVNAHGGRHGYALLAASECGHERVVKMLLDAGADIDAQTGGRRPYGHALHAASAGGHETVVKLLLDAGADVNAQERRQYSSALQTASRGGHETVVQMLMAAGADVNAQGYYGSALQRASDGGHETVVKMLLDAGADVNAKGGVYSNAIHAASERGHETVVKMLVGAGAISEV